MEKAYKYTVTNLEISNALEEFGYPVHYGGITEDEVKDFNFFYYRESEITGDSNPSMLVQNVNIYFSSKNLNHLLEPEIIMALKEIKLNFKRAEYDRLRIESTNDFVDVVTFICSRKIKLVC